MNNIVAYPVPEQAPRSNDFKVFVGGQEVGLYCSQSRYGSAVSFGGFDFTGSVEVKVEISFGACYNNCFDILPASLGIVPTRLDDFSCTFTLSRPEKLTLLINGDYTGRILHLFAGAPMDGIPDENDPSVIAFKAGYHVIDGENSELCLQSGQTLYLEGGAYVEGRVTAEDAQNIRICGRGVLACTKNQPLYSICLEIMKCSDIEISGIIINRQYGIWTGNFNVCEQIHVHDLKIVSTGIWSTDGLNLCNCRDVVYENSFIRSGDDCIAIKGMENGGPNAPDIQKAMADSHPNENIEIRDMTFWSDNNNAVVLGEETVAKYYNNIAFRRCEVLFSRDEEKIKAAIAIVSIHGTLIQNVVFEDFNVGPCGQLVAIFFGDSVFGMAGELYHANGVIKNILVQNVETFGPGSKAVRVQGYNERNMIESITLKDIWIKGKKLTDTSDYLITNDYIRRLEVL